ncbi:MAG: SH3 domain-containing protein [Clostridia bacterium]|nr:SH3 domain-containing protein [Clostridia bacterium]
MLKIVSIIISFLALLPLDVKYACMENGATLYSYDGSKYTELARLPSSYYVAVLKESDDGYLLVSYLDTTGYIKASELSRVDFTPKQKYASARFTVSNDSQPANLRARPDKSSQIVAVMPDNARGTIIGTISGSELIAGAGKTWYYVRYENGETVSFGYAYSAHLNAESFGTNSGEREPEKTDGNKETQEGQPVFEMSLPLRIILISVLCLPVFAALFMLRPKKKKGENSV